jgi:pimeloyl-ACP methyl ester carboxylesterase
MSTTADSIHPKLQAKAEPVAVRRARLRRRIASLALGSIGLAAVIATAGAGFEWIAGARDAAAYPAAGRLVDAGGHRLHLDCRGAGAPTVVMDAGLGGSSLDWSLVQPELAGLTQVCTYDRAGMGWSETGPAPRSPSQLAEELHTLLENGGVPGPYVLVGHSLAGKTVRLFAASHPADVAGMVLVDARSEAVEAASDLKAFAAALDAQAAIYSLVRTFGVARLFGGAILDLPLVPPALATQMALLATNPAAIEATTQEGLNRTADDDALAAATLGAMPLMVVAAGENMSDPDWAAAQAGLSELSTRGRLIVAEGSGHAVHLQQPAIVIDAINRVVEAVRSDD